MKSPAPGPLTGLTLWAPAITLSMVCFIAILDLTITNVALPTIAGGLAITPSQSVWTITSYAVAEGVSVPLTGWLSVRFGGVRVITISMIMFGAFSLFCGLSTTLAMLVMSRIVQGWSGGLMMALSQTYMLRIFPPAKAGIAMAAWALPGLIAPVLGPFLGGWLCETISWPFIFFINLPFAALCAVLLPRLLTRYENQTARDPIDVLGFGLLVVFVGALQIMLDIGKDHDWFESTAIRVLAGVAAIGFAAFLFWELTDRHPIVNLRVFRTRAFAANTVLYATAYSATFCGSVLTPLWLQTYMGYSATMAGLTMSWNAVLAILMTPVAGVLIGRFDPRIVACVGFTWTMCTMWMRSHYSIDATNWQIVLPLILMGAGMPIYFIPVVTTGLRSVNENETASAAGLQSFVRTVTAAFAVSIVTTAWEYKTTHVRSGLSGFVDRGGSALGEMKSLGLSQGVSLRQLDAMLQTQSAMIALNQIMLIVTVIYALCAVCIWLTPKPKHSR
jgi:DHA2 family multidrug resistance protein